MRVGGMGMGMGMNVTKVNKMFRYSHRRRDNGKLRR